MRPHAMFVIPTLTALSQLVLAGDAHAFCDTLFLTNHDQDVIIGEWVVGEDCDDPENVFSCSTVDRTGQAAACVIDGGVPELVIFDCSEDDIAAEQLELHTAGGNDRVSPMMSYHIPYSAQPLFVGSLRCGANDMLLGAWPSDFQFGLAAYLGDGSDRFWGSPNKDWAVSSEWSWGATPFYADNSWDVLCGLGGDDYLGGDRDDNYLAGHEEILVGGDGADRCDGDPDSGYNGNDGNDLYFQCETHSDAAYQSSIALYCLDDGNPLQW